MKFFFHTLAFILLLSNVAYFQTPTPTAKTVKDDDIVKISTSLIQIDVTATDNRGKIVADLNKQDFEIYENGEKQDVTSFSFISANSGRIRKTRSKTSKSEIAPPPSVVKADRNTVRRTIALVVDDLTLSFQSVYYVRRALRKFVNEQMKEGDLVAIIRTGGGIGALQQFTYSRKQLLAAAKNIRWNPRGSGGIGAFAPIAATPLEQERANGAVITDEEIEEERGRLRENDQIRDDIFATGTMGAVNYIVRGMKELPGRKSIILLSDGFQLFSVDRAGFASSNRTLDAARRLVDLANRASVVIYSVDSRGLQTTGITAADSVGSLSPAAARQRAGERNARLLDTQGGLKYLSEETGGFAVVNNNDISGGVERILDDQSYYLIGYEPDSETFDPEKRKFNKLEVKVKRRGVKVRYRSGFFGVSDKQPKLATSNLTPKQLILNAISSPFAVNDIKLRLNTLFKGNESNKIALSSFVHIDTNDLQLADGPDGKKQISFDILAMNFGKNGTPLDQIGKTYTISLSDKMVDEFKSEGFVYYFTFPIKTFTLSLLMT